MQQIIQHIKQSLHPFYPAPEVTALTSLILEKKFGITMKDIYMGKDTQFLPKQKIELEDILHRLQNNEPAQYILGEADFCGLSFKVNPHVLIPRPETAELVYWILNDWNSSTTRILDIGTGSGCIPISLAKHHPEATFYAWDISLDALKVAQENNRNNGTHVCFEQNDVFALQNSTQKFDLIVSNPPYITLSEKSEMEANVLQWEPGLALFVPNEDPLRFYRRIAQLGKDLLSPLGLLYFEINRAYGNETVAMLKELGYSEIELKKDLSGNDRMIKAKINH